MAGPKLINPGELIQAGINPKTGLPLKMGGTPCSLKEDVRKILRIIDEQDAINRFKWYNLPDGLDGQLLERILYYKGQGAFFYMETDNKFYFLPYALDGTIDVYGRFTGITPLPFGGGTASDGKEKPWITGLIRKPVYSIKLDEITSNFFKESCVLLKDYSPQYNQTIISRQIVNEPLLNTMAECIPFMRTSMIAGTGIKGMRVDDADQERSVKVAADAITNAALTGEMYVPVVVPVELQELTDGALAKSDEYMMAMQSLDNFRLSTYGLDNGGLFQKKERMIVAEQAVNGGNVGLVYQDSLTLRQNFCDIINSIWGLGIWVEPSEAVLGMDQNMDGAAYDISENNYVGGDDGSDYSGSDDSGV